MNVLNHNGVVLSGEDLKSYTQRHGLCHICAQTQTHKRSGKFFKKLRNRWQPLTVRNPLTGEYTVYKGYCIQPTCYTLEQVQRKLGEYRRSSYSIHGGSSIGSSRGGGRRRRFSGESDGGGGGGGGGSCDTSLDTSFPGTTASSDPGVGTRSFEYLAEEGYAIYSRLQNQHQNHHHRGPPPPSSSHHRVLSSPRKNGQTTTTMGAAVDSMSPISTTSSLTSLGGGGESSSSSIRIPKSIIPRPPLVVGSHLPQHHSYGEHMPSSPPSSGNNSFHGRPPPYSPRLSLKHRLDQFLSSSEQKHKQQQQQQQQGRTLDLTGIEMSETNVATVLSVFQQHQYEYEWEDPSQQQSQRAFLTTFIADQCKLGDIASSTSILERLLNGLLLLPSPNDKQQQLLKKLSLRSNGLNAFADAKVLARYLSQDSYTSLEELNLSKNKLEGSGAELMLTAICSCNNNDVGSGRSVLRNLNLSNNDIWDLNLQVFQDFCRKTFGSLVILNLENNYLRDAGVQIVCDAILSSVSSSSEISLLPCLEKLYLANNAFRNPGGMALAGLLETHPSILVLGLGQNGIDTIGAQYILEAIRRRTRHPHRKSEDGGIDDATSISCLKEISGLYTNRIANKKTIKAIEQCLEESILQTFSDRQVLSLETESEEERRSYTTTTASKTNQLQLDVSCTDITFDATDAAADLNSNASATETCADTTGAIENHDEGVTASSGMQVDNEKIVASTENLGVHDMEFVNDEIQDCDVSKDQSRADTESTQPDDSMTILSGKSDVQEKERMIESLLLLPTLQASTSNSAGLSKEAYRGRLDALDLASWRPGNGSPIRNYRHQELKTVCLSGEGGDDGGVEAIAFTLGSHEISSHAPNLGDETSDSDSESTSSSSEYSDDDSDVDNETTANQLDAADQGIEAGVEVSLFSFQSNSEESPPSPCPPSPQPTTEQASIEIPKFESRVALEAEIADCKNALKVYEQSDDPAARRLRIKMRKKLIANMNQRRSLPSRQELEQRIEELDIEIAASGARDTGAREILHDERNHIKRQLQKETTEEKKLKLDVSCHSQSSRMSRSIGRQSLPPVPVLPPKEEPASRPMDKLTVFQSAPLSFVDVSSNDRHYFPLLDFEYEARILKQALKDAQRIGAKIELEFEVATTDRLSAFFAQGGRRILHLSCHGHPEYLALENGFGDMQPLVVKDLKRFLYAGHATLDFVFVSACHSKSAGMAFLNAGVRHVVCCQQDARFRDEGAVEFARHFYRALACDRTLEQAFNMAKEAVRVSPIVKDSVLESDKFLLLPEKAEGDLYHDVNVFFTDETYTPRHIDSPKMPPRILQRVPGTFLGREKDMYSILDAMRNTDMIQITGSPGVGKSCLVAAICRYIQQRQTSFLFDDILWLPAPQDFVETKDWLCSDFSKMFFMLNHRSISSREVAPTYKECWSCILRGLHEKRCLLVIDGRRFQTQQSLRNLDAFLTDLLAISNVKIILIGGKDKLNFKLTCRVLEVEALDYDTSAVLFARLVQSARYSASEIATVLMKVVGTNHRQESKLYSKRKTAIFDKIGKGLPGDIERTATQMSDKDLVDLIRLAQRPLVQANTRGDLEEAIQKVLSEEAVALRQQHYLRARDLRDQIEELQSLRVQLPTVQDMEADIRKLKEMLITTVSARRYDTASKIQTRIANLEEQIRQERKSEENRNEEKFNKIRDKARRLKQEKIVRQGLSHA